jgi:hypothetical protein
MFFSSLEELLHIGNFDLVFAFSKFKFSMGQGKCLLTGVFHEVFKVPYKPRHLFVNLGILNGPVFFEECHLVIDQSVDLVSLFFKHRYSHEQLISAELGHFN